MGVVITEARLINYEELTDLGCKFSLSKCTSAPSWVYSSFYWTGIGETSPIVYCIHDGGKIMSVPPTTEIMFGVRPVIVISKDYFN